MAEDAAKLQEIQAQVYAPESTREITKQAKRAIKQKCRGSKLCHSCSFSTSAENLEAVHPKEECALVVQILPLAVRNAIKRAAELVEKVKEHDHAMDGVPEADLLDFEYARRAVDWARGVHKKITKAAESAKVAGRMAHAMAEAGGAAALSLDRGEQGAVDGSSQSRGLKGRVRAALFASALSWHRQNSGTSSLGIEFVNGVLEGWWSFLDEANLRVFEHHAVSTGGGCVFWPCGNCSMGRRHTAHIIDAFGAPLWSLLTHVAVAAGARCSTFDHGMEAFESIGIHHKQIASVALTKTVSACPGHHADFDGRTRWQDGITREFMASTGERTRLALDTFFFGSALMRNAIHRREGDTGEPDWLQCDAAVIKDFVCGASRVQQQQQQQQQRQRGSRAGGDDAPAHEQGLKRERPDAETSSAAAAATLDAQLATVIEREGGDDSPAGLARQAAVLSTVALTQAQNVLDQMRLRVANAEKTLTALRHQLGHAEDEVDTIARCAKQACLAADLAGDAAEARAAEEAS